MIRSLVRWACTVPGNLRSLRGHWRMQRQSGGFDVDVDPDFDPGDEHYWFHFTKFYVRIRLLGRLVEFGIKDSN